jgi:MFS family permease
MNPTLNEKSSSSLLPWFMWALGALFYCYEFFLQVSPNVMVQDLMLAYHLTAAQMGYLSTSYYIAYAAMQLPVGMLLDRFGTRVPLTIAVLLCAIGTLTFCYAHVLAVAAFGRFLIGIGSAFAAVSCMQIAANWLPLNRFALMTGLLLTIGMIGAWNGQAPLGMLIHTIGWRETLLLFGFVGCILAGIIMLVIRDKPRASHLSSHSKTSFFAGLKHVASGRQNWIVALYGGLMFLSIPGFAGLWSVSFFSQSNAVTSTEAAFVVSMIFVGFAVGAPLLGWFSDRIARRKPPMYFGTIGSLITMSTIIYGPPLSSTLAALLFFGFGFFCSGFLPVFSVAREVNPPETSGTALGFINTLNTAGGMLAQPAIGYLLDLNWHGEMQGGVRFYNTANYHIALSILPIAIALSLIVLFFVRETHCKDEYN